ncbi:MULTISPECIES: hypothetical protein, partial [Streptomyces]|uniref:hypothetical protein n=1 Tax=Streptomyces TaxID=1883 RepID=UPI00192CF122
MARALRVFATALGMLLSAVALGVGASPGTASALDTGRGRAGFCPDANGVTVVVDFRELGGTTIVRCAVGSQASGLAALKAAGIDVTGTNRWGESFICRLEGSPGPDREPCVDTPPTKAYWSYWHAPNGGAWTYSQQGATYRTPPTGSFEGWSFSLDREQGEAPSPRVAPKRPSGTGPGSGGSGASGASGGSGSSGGGGNSTG